jgi:ketol-acid reductoisomerase
MTNMFQDRDTDLKVLKNETITIIGYGSQGRSQALNMGDSGIKVIVGNISDASLERTKADGFPAYSIREATEKATIIFLLLPDEVQPKVYETEIKPAMKKGKAQVFAHGSTPRSNVNECIPDCAPPVDQAGQW